VLLPTKRATQECWASADGYAKQACARRCQRRRAIPRQAQADLAGGPAVWDWACRFEETIALQLIHGARWTSHAHGRCHPQCKDSVCRYASNCAASCGGLHTLSSPRHLSELALLVVAKVVTRQAKRGKVLQFGSSHQYRRPGKAERAPHARREAPRAQSCGCWHQLPLPGRPIAIATAWRVTVRPVT